MPERLPPGERPEPQQHRSEQARSGARVRQAIRQRRLTIDQIVVRLIPDEWPLTEEESLGIQAEAHLLFPMDDAARPYVLVDSLHSGGLFGVSPASDRSYLTELAADQLQQLKVVLLQVGLPSRAIAPLLREAERTFQRQLPLPIP